MNSAEFQALLVSEVNKPRRMRYAAELDDAVQMAAQRALERYEAGEFRDMDEQAFGKWFNRQVATQGRCVQRKTNRRPVHTGERPDLIQSRPDRVWIRAAVAEALPECEEIAHVLASGHGQKATAAILGISERRVRDAVAKLREALA